jgi:hypothetical protein
MSDKDNVERHTIRLPACRTLSSPIGERFIGATLPARPPYSPTMINAVKVTWLCS